MHGLASLKLALLTLCASASAQFVLHNSRAAPPSGYTHQGPAPAGQTLALRVALASNNIAGLEAKLLDISNPESPNYAKWLSAGVCLRVMIIFWLTQNPADELQAYLQPPKDTTAAFTSFARANGLQLSASPMGDWVQFTTTVEHANTLFNASYQTFVHEGTSQTLTRTLSYSLPQALVGHVNTVLPTTSFDVQSARLTPAPKQPVNRAIPASCNNTITPSCLQVRYHLFSRPKCRY
jgi:tripeptidyl-peptidase-1